MIQPQHIHPHERIGTISIQINRTSLMPDRAPFR
jgi:hypothetical protein